MGSAGPIVNAGNIIRRLDLKEHPEGGYYREIYRSPVKVKIGGLERCAATCIYFLLTKDAFSAFHRLRFDEIWHFLKGTALRIHCLHEKSGLRTVELGCGADGTRQSQHVIPAGTWFAAEVAEGDFALLGCTLAPGFEFMDFELARRERLISDFPRYGELITRLTR